MSIAYIGSKLRTERPRKTEIGTEVADVTCDYRHHFQGQKVEGQLAGGGAYCGGLPHSFFTLDLQCSMTNGQVYTLLSYLYWFGEVSSEFVDFLFAVQTAELDRLHC